ARSGSRSKVEYRCRKSPACRPADAESADHTTLLSTQEPAPQRQHVKIEIRFSSSGLTCRCEYIPAVGERHDTARSVFRTIPCLCALHVHDGSNRQSILRNA